jgi:hypothetical protein
MNKRLAVAAVVLSLVAPSAFADFSHVARAMERRLGTNRTWIPFLGIARALVRTVHPQGVHDVQLAVFEGHRNVVSGRDVEQMLKGTVDKAYTPIVRVYSAKKGEWTFIYANAKPKRAGVVDLLIVAHEDKETVVVRVVADAAMVAQGLGQPVNIAQIGRGGRGRSGIGAEASHR